MNPLVAKGNWNIAKGKVKQAYARITHDNLQLVEGKVGELLGRIQKHEGRTRRHMERAPETDDEPGCSHR